MNLILLGAPGAGKGTQAELLTEKLGIPAISTGNMLREAMRNETETGRKVKHYMDNGLLVPDDVILAIVRDRVSCPDCAGGFILDGVPRTIAQAQGLEALGAQVRAVGETLYLTGHPLHGGSVEAPDLRGGAALTLAALAAEGESRITGLRHIDRGYEALEQDLAALGADIRRETLCML